LDQLLEFEDNAAVAHIIAPSPEAMLGKIMANREL
jgi:hypothetical protein